MIMHADTTTISTTYSVRVPPVPAYFRLTAERQPKNNTLTKVVYSVSLVIQTCTLLIMMILIIMLLSCVLSVNRSGDGLDRSRAALRVCPYA